MPTIPRLLLPAAVLMASLFGASCSSDAGAPATPPQAAAKPPVPVRVQIAVRKDMPLVVHAIGTMQASSVLAVHTEVTGVLTSVHFREGSHIDKDQLLFTIDERPFQQALALAVAGRDKDVAALAQAKANQRRDDAQRHNAELETNRYQSLLKEGMASAEQAEQERTNLDALVATVDADRAACNTAQAQLAADDAVVENAKVQLSYCSIRSPIDGQAGALQINQGNLVIANTSLLVTINCLRPIYTTFAVPEGYLSNIHTYQALAPLEVDVTDRGLDAVTQVGALDLVDNQVDPTTGTIQLRATFANADSQLWPGTFENVDLRLKTESKVLVVPSQAVQSGQVGTFVYVIGKELTAELRPIVVERIDNSSAILTSGVEPGEQVVVDGQSNLVANAKVEIRDADQTPPAAGASSDNPTKTAAR